MLETKGLTKRYGRHTVVDDLSFSCEPGEVLGFLGPNGAGKSTTMKMVTGFVAPSAGTASICGHDILTDTLSKGFKRRVGLAQAILHDPDVLILDEPTDGLDPNQKHEVRQLIRSMSEEKLIVISTHILEEVNAVCTRAIIIADGRILVDDTPKNLTEQGDGDLDVVFRRVTQGSDLPEAEADS